MAGSSDERIVCPSCGKQYRWKEELVGRKVRCKCGEAITVEAAAAPEEDYELALDLGDDGTISSPQQPPAAEAAATATTKNVSECPGCGAKVKPGVVICIECGTNVQTGEALNTEVGRAVKTAGGRQKLYTGSVDGFFGKIGRSWQFLKIAMGILRDFKQLLIFPVLSGIAAVLVLASFLLPLWGTGTLEQLDQIMDEESAAQGDVVMYAIVFAFYFCNFFVIAFFNTALAACALRVCAGEAPTIRYGLGIACKRLPQIIGWALVSATVGLILKIIENSSEKVGQVIAALMGVGWTVLTYFVVPVLAVEGVGPFKAVKQSVKTLKDTWGEAVFGNFSMGVLVFITLFPVYLIFGVMIYLSIAWGSSMLLLAAIAGLVVVLLLAATVSSAADIVFRSLLYNYATGRTIPEEVDESMFAAAFAGKS